IETVAKKGYRFVAETKRTNGDEADVSRFAAEVGPATNGNGSHTTTAPLPMPGVGIDVDTKNEINSTALARALSAFALIVVVFFLIAGFWLVRRSLSDPTVKGASRQTPNGEAYQHYRQAKLLLERKLKGDEKAALDEFEKAIELD